MARPDKAAKVAELTNEFSSSNAAVLTEYRGLTVAELKDLRRALGEDASYAVAKNTLTAIAAKEAGIEGLDDQLSGPTAIAFIKGDVAAVAKKMQDFAKDQPLLVIKGGVMDGKVLDVNTVKRLANLEPREVLLAKLAGAMKASTQGAVSMFAAPLTQAAQLLGALQDKAQADPSVIGGAGEAAAAPAAAADQAAPAAETAADATAEPVEDQKPDTAADAAPAAEAAAPADQAGETTDAADDAASNE